MLAEEEQKRLQDVLNGGPIVDLLLFEHRIQTRQSDASS